jgi:hypothetical protein
MVEDTAQEDPKIEPEAPIVEAESVLEEKPEELSSEHPAEPEAIDKGEETVDDVTETETPKDAPIEVVCNLFEDIFSIGFSWRIVGLCSSMIGSVMHINHYM